MQKKRVPLLLTEECSALAKQALLGGASEERVGLWKTAVKALETAIVVILQQKQQPSLAAGPDLFLAALKRVRTVPQSVLARSPAFAAQILFGLLDVRSSKKLLQNAGPVAVVLCDWAVRRLRKARGSSPTPDPMLPRPVPSPSIFPPDAAEAVSALHEEMFDMESLARIGEVLLQRDSLVPKVVPQQLEPATKPITPPLARPVPVYPPLHFPSPPPPPPPPPAAAAPPAEKRKKQQQRKSRKQPANSRKKAKQTEP